MSRSFTKLFSSITESTVWCEPMATRLVWITLLAMADKDGCVWASVPGLANRARVSIDEADIALRCFLSPDAYSRTPDREGRRIEAIDGGWCLLNHAKYRQMASIEDRKDYQRQWDEKRRVRQNPTNPDTARQQTTNPTHAEAEADADSDAESKRKRKTKARALKSSTAERPKTTPQFEALWDAYPKKVQKLAAIAAFHRLSPDAQKFARIMASIDPHERSEQWCEGVRWIPNLANYLDAEGWLDELDE